MLVARRQSPVAADTRLANPRAALPAELNDASRGSTVSVWVVRGLIEAVERSGVPRDELLRAAELTPELLDAAETRLPLELVYRLCELAMELTRDPALGLHWAGMIGEGTFMPVSPLIAHASTLRQAFDVLARFYRLISDHAGYQITEHQGTVTVQTMTLGGESERMRRFMGEMIAGGFFRTLRYFKVDAGPPRVSFEHSAPDYHEEYTHFFGTAHAFDQPFTGVVFDSALLDASPPHKDEEVHDALKTLAERRLLRITRRAPYAVRVRELLVHKTLPQRTDMETVARALGLSVRSLRRCLEAEGKTYNGVVNETLSIMAKHLLHDDRRTIQETAFEMGFSDASTFHRAFKSWTGMTPSAYRKTQR